MRAPLVLAVLLFGAALWVRTGCVDPQFQARQSTDAGQDAFRSPGRQVLAWSTLQHPLMFADLLWLAIVQHLGSQEVATDAGWSRVERWSNIATDLDPKYFNLYHAPALHLALYGKRIDASDRLLLKGWAELPHRWELPFTVGYNAYFERGDPRLGAEYMLAASRLPRAPAYLAALAGRMRYQAGDHQGAIEMLEMMLPDLDGPALRDAEERLAILRSQPRFEAYDRACEVYLARTGTVPRSGEELHRMGLVDEPPFDLLDHPIRFEGNCTARTDASKIREHEALEKLKRPSELQLEATEPQD